METIKVNMNPNPLDVQTIHASQNDGEARQWGFKLHNNGDVIDSSEITDQMVFKAYKGGTEQLLPENTSTPTTSPFKGDIRYPQGLLTDQEFTYRQSPTEEDGNAKIKNLYGNTLVWNQLVPSLSAMSGQNGTISVADNVATITSSSSASYLGIATSGSSIVLPKGGHKYLLTCEFKSSKALLSCNLWYGNELAYIQRNISANTWTKVSTIASYGTPTGQYVQLRAYGSFEQGDTMQVRNWNYFDLTAMGLDSLTEDEFASLFPLPFYDFNQGTLIPFSGNGIKTVGFNQWDEEWENGGISVTTGGSEVRNTSIRSKNFIPIFPNSTYYFKLPSATYPFFYDENYNYIGFHGSGNTILNKTFVPSALTNSASGGGSFANAKYMKFRCDNGGTYEDNICLNFSSDRNGTYEPYTSSTLSLPISTYFPNGMKSAGNVYDELTPSKAVTRIGTVDLGSMSWTAITQNNITRMRSYDIKALIKYPTANNRKFNGICTKYDVLTANNTYDGQIGISCQNNGDIYVYDSAYSTAEAFKTAMGGVYLYYELATPTETSFTTASLVTENAEIPLSNNDGVLIGKCTEELSENPGFIDAKIKLADSDGECYSNKIQLHVERSPK